MSARDTDELRRLFRDEHEFAMAPLRDFARSNYENAIKFADSGIKSLFGLNGGGLIALPAFATLFKADMHGATVWIAFAAVGMFVLGLAGAALTCLFGYSSAMKAMESAHCSLAATTTKYAAHYGQAPQTPTTPVEIKKAEDAARKCTARSILLRAIAVTSSVVSLVAFIAGACLAAWALAPLT